MAEYINPHPFDPLTPEEISTVIAISVAFNLRYWC